ncbi:MAG: sigma-70 family RNA polymerase sigma factor [Vicingaceae bacterium]
MNDEEIIEGCKQNNPKAQKKLFDAYSRKMMGVCLRYSKNEDDAQDVLQLGFIKVFEKIEMFNYSGSLEGWIRRIMINTALDFLRKNKYHDQNIEMDKVEYQLHYQQDMMSKFSHQELLKLIQQLPTGFRTVFNLYAIEGYSHKEIGEMLGISENTSKSQYSRAKVHLQKMIVEDKLLER